MDTFGAAILIGVVISIASASIAVSIDKNTAAIQACQGKKP